MHHIKLAWQIVFSFWKVAFVLLYLRPPNYTTQEKPFNAVGDFDDYSVKSMLKKDSSLLLPSRIWLRLAAIAALGRIVRVRKTKLFVNFVRDPQDKGSFLTNSVHLITCRNVRVDEGVLIAISGGKYCQEKRTLSAVMKNPKNPVGTHFRASSAPPKYTLNRDPLDCGTSP